MSKLSGSPAQLATFRGIVLLPPPPRAKMDPLLLQQEMTRHHQQNQNDMLATAAPIKAKVAIIVKKMTLVLSKCHPHHNC